MPTIPGSIYICYLPAGREKLCPRSWVRSCSSARKFISLLCPFISLSCVCIMAKFSAIIFLSKLQRGNPIYVVLMPVRSWLFGNKMLPQYPFSVKHVFRFRVSATECFYFLFLSPLCSQFFLKFSLLRIPLKVFDEVQSVYRSHFYFHSTKLRKEPIKLSFSLWSL